MASTRTVASGRIRSKVSTISTGTRAGPPVAPTSIQSMSAVARSEPERSRKVLCRRAHTRREPWTSVETTIASPNRTGAPIARRAPRTSQVRPRSRYQVRSKPAISECTQAASWAKRRKPESRSRPSVPLSSKRTRTSTSSRPGTAMGRSLGARPAPARPVTYVIRRVPGRGGRPGRFASSASRIRAWTGACWSSSARPETDGDRKEDDRDVPSGRHHEHPRRRAHQGAARRSGPRKTGPDRSKRHSTPSTVGTSPIVPHPKRPGSQAQAPGRLYLGIEDP